MTEGSKYGNVTLAVALFFFFLLRYDISELWETGGGVEMWLQKLQNGIRVFHYVG